MPIPTKTFAYYFQRVQIQCGLQNVTFPPITNVADWQNATDVQQRIKWALDERLQYINQKYYLAFQRREYVFATVLGQLDYDLSQPPYSQLYWRMARVARNGLIRVNDGIVLGYADYTTIDQYKPTIVPPSRPVMYTHVDNTFLRLFPKPSGESLIIRYYPTAIATDLTGINLQNELILSTDLPILNDEWSHALVAGAITMLRLTDRVDVKTKAFHEEWERWEIELKDRTKPGEDAKTLFLVETNTRYRALRAKMFPFGTPYT